MKTYGIIALFTLGITFATAHKCALHGRHGQRCRATADQWPFDQHSALWHHLMDPTYTLDSVFRAAYHIVESPAEYRMEVELPGVDASTISLDVTADTNNDRILKLSCDHKRTSTSSCSREWQLARDVDDSSRIEAHYSGDGLLEVVVPKRVAAPDPIKINVTGRSTAAPRISSTPPREPVEDRVDSPHSASHIRWQEVQEVTSKLREQVERRKHGDDARAKPATTITDATTTVESTTDHFIPSAAPAEDANAVVAPAEEATSEEVVDLDDTDGAMSEAAAAAPSHPGQPL